MATYQIRNDVPVALQLAPENETESILQNVALILSTVKGTVPMYRDFGVDGDYIDRPQTVAQVLITRAVTEAVARYEPRCTVTGVTIEWDTEQIGKYIVIAEVEI